MLRIIVLILLAFGLIIMYFYNRFIRNKNRVADAWASIDVQLKRRYDLIPNLVETVKGYATHEKDLFEKIADARARALGATDVQDQLMAENQLTQSLKSLFALSESYPDLKANTSFRQLQDQLSKIEDDIQMSRRYYNAAVRENNNALETFPGNVIAGMFNFVPSAYFEMEDTERSVPKVNFS
jgi:LemA protein